MIDYTKTDSLVKRITTVERAILFSYAEICESSGLSIPEKLSRAKEVAESGDCLNASVMVIDTIERNITKGDETFEDVLEALIRHYSDGTNPA